MERRQRTDDDELPAMPLARRALLVVLAAATAVAIVLMLTERPGDPKRGRQPAVPEARPCRPGQSTDCVGGKADVIVVPIAPAASAPR